MNVLVVRPFLLARLEEVEYLFFDRIEQNGQVNKCLSLERVRLLRTINRLDKGLPLKKGWTLEEKDLKDFSYITI